MNLASRLLSAAKFSDSIRSDVIRLTQSFVPRHTALLVRGSVAQNTAGQHSDVDLILLTSGRHEDSAAEIENLIREHTKLDPSVASWRFERNRVDPHLSHWYAMRTCRYLAGSQDLVRDWKTSSREHLRRLTPGTLARTYLTDPKRHLQRNDFQTSLSRNWKRGHGGIIDCEFVALLHWWMESQSQLPNRFQMHLRLSRFAFRALSFIKLCLHDIFDTQVEALDRLDECAGELDWFKQWCLCVMRANGMVTTSALESLHGLA
jgi:UTP:GlnB (protein PII) uridylyltransferase